MMEYNWWFTTEGIQTRLETCPFLNDESCNIKKSDCDEECPLDKSHIIIGQADA
jgi:hypothetical protein